MKTLVNLAGRVVLLCSFALGCFGWELRSETLDRWQWRSPLPQGNDLYSLAHGNGIYVAVGDFGTLLVSSNGVEWMVRSLETNSTLTAVAFGAGLFVAVGSESFGSGVDAIFTSVDGLHWTYRTTSLTNGLRGVAWGGGRFVAVGSGCSVCGPYSGSAAILVSTNGVDWAASIPATNSPLWAVARGLDSFVAVGTSSLQYSADGVIWREATSPTNGTLNAVTFGNGRFVAVGSTVPYAWPEVPIIATSANGRDWALAGFVASPDPGAWLRLDAVTYGPGRFVVIGSGSSWPSSLAWASEDGVTWTNPPILFPMEWPEAVLWGGDQFVAVGDYGSIVLSSDGQDWVPVNRATSNNLRGAAHGNGRFVAVGNTGVTATSPDGLFWDWPNAPTGVNLHDLVFARSQFFVVGSSGTILSTPDGETWEPRSSGTSEDLYGIASGNGVLVAVGGARHGDCDDGCWFSHALLTSSDGLSWSNTLPGFLNIRLHGIAFGNGQFAAVGGLGAILTSSNGLDWVRQDAAPWVYFKDVDFGNGAFVTVGESRLIYRSTNLVDWVSSRPPVDLDYYELNEVTFAEGVFVVVGDFGIILTSTNGLEWTRRHSPTTTNLRGMTYGDSRFVIVGNNDTILQNGTNATPSSGTNPPLFRIVSQPESQMVSPGANVVLTVAVAPDWPVTYQWRRNGTNIPGATQPMRILPSVQEWDSGFYSVEVTQGERRLVSEAASLLVTSTDPLNVWQPRTTPGAARLLRDVVWAKDSFVAVGDAGTILTSPDGATWTPQTSGTNRPLYRIAFGQDRFVAVGEAGVILTSFDGITWTPRNGGANPTLFGITHGGGLFVAAGALGAILTSPDGIVWANRSVSLPMNPFYAVAYGRGRFVAMSAGGPVVTSTDAVQWNQGTNLANPFTSVTWNGQRFIAVGGNRLYTSEDGLAWTLRQSLVLYANGVGYGVGRSVAVGSSGLIYSSPDGVSWTPQNSGVGFSLQAVAYGRGTFLGVGYSGSTVGIVQSGSLVPVPPTIEQQPTNRFVRLGYGFTNSVFARGAPDPLYRWRRNDIDLPHATNSTYAVTNAAPADSGDYSVVAMNPVGAVTSAVAEVRVGLPPTLVVQPLAQSVVRGGSVTLSVMATGSPPLAFRWVRNGQTAQYEQTDTTVSFFTLTNVQATNTIRVALTNAWSPPNPMSPLIRVVPLDDFDSDGLPDEWEARHGLKFDDPADATLDTDQDGASNLAEYQAGTDPQDQQTVLKLEIVSLANVTLQFMALSNKTYTVQYADTLDRGAWARLLDVLAGASNRIEFCTDPAVTGRTRFYRIITPRRE